MLDTREVQDWITENGTGHQERRIINGIHFLFVTRNDGWIAVFSVDEGMYSPKFEASGMAHALSRCNLMERVNVPLNRFP